MDQQPQRHLIPVTPMLWIGMSLVALLGFVQGLETGPRPTTFPALNPDDRIILRSSGEVRFFATLELEIEPRDGWTCLSTTDDAIAMDATFVHAAEQCLVQIRHNWFPTWPPEKLATHTRNYGSNVVEWFELDHRSIGRLRNIDTDVILIVVDPGHRAPWTNPALERLIETIRPRQFFP